MKRRPAKNTARRARRTVRRLNPARKTTARAALTYDAVVAMGAAEINKRLDALDRESSAITDEFIATGRGHERPSERRHKTDPLSLRDAQNSHDRYVLHAEIARRYGPGAPSRLPTRAARTIRTRNPSKRSVASRHRNPAPKPRTYAIARADILRALRADGWDVRENLKVPHATHPNGDFRLWFKTQAIYFTTGDRRRGCGSLSDALSLWIGDIRTMPVAEVLADIERSRRQSVGPHRNPSQDDSTNGTVVEYAVLNLFKRMSVEKAARVTAEKLSGKSNIFIGGGITSIDPKRLETAIWDRLIQYTMRGIAMEKPGKEEYALINTVDKFLLGKKDQKTLKSLVESEWGQKLPTRASWSLRPT